MTRIGSPRVIAVLHVLLVAQLALLALAIAGTHGAFGPVAPTSTAYISFYAAGRLAAAGTPALAYDQAVHFALEQAITLPGIDYKFFYYPPVFLLLCRVLAIPLYLASFVLFVLATLGLLVAAMRRLFAATTGRPLPAGWLVFILAFPPVFWTLGWGQNAFLTASIFCAGLLLLERRPFLAGLVLGLLCYKPHFGLLLPVALLAGGYWFAVSGAAISVAALCAASLALFGVEAWTAYLAAALSSAQTYESGRVNLAFYVTPFGGALLLGAPRWAAYAVQVLASLAAAGCVAWAWWRRAAFPVRAAALLAGTVLAVPLALVYDLMLLLPAMAWLLVARAGRELPREGAALAVAYLAPFAVVSLGMGLSLPVGPLASALVLFLAMRRAAAEPADWHPPPLGAASRRPL